VTSGALSRAQALERFSLWGMTLGMLSELLVKADLRAPIPLFYDHEQGLELQRQRVAEGAAQADAAAQLQEREKL